jgi:hypothetical protein
VLSRRNRPQLLVFTYHKTGTVLFEQIMKAVAARFGLRLWERYGVVERIEPAADIAILPHSLLAPGFAEGHFRAVRVVRDPRDIWVSGYFYHRRCREAWCTNVNFDPTPPILYPRVDFSVQHRPEEWKRAYLERLGGRSYQQNLLLRDRAAGLAFELEGYTGWTLEAMRDWRLDGEVLDVRLEDIGRDFDGTLTAVFRHLGFVDADCRLALELARPFDIAQMSDEAVAGNPHIHSRQVSKWREVLSPMQVVLFERQYVELIVRLGYPLAIPP